jgi:hypothetical protein
MGWWNVLKRREEQRIEMRRAIREANKQTKGKQVADLSKRLSGERDAIAVRMYVCACVLLSHQNLGTATAFQSIVQAASAWMEFHTITFIIDDVVVESLLIY